MGRCRLIGVWVPSITEDPADCHATGHHGFFEPERAQPFDAVEDQYPDHQDRCRRDPPPGRVRTVSASVRRPVQCSFARTGRRAHSPGGSLVCGRGGRFVRMVPSEESSVRTEQVGIVRTPRWSSARTTCAGSVHDHHEPSCGERRQNASATIGTGHGDGQSVGAMGSGVCVRAATGTCAPLTGSVAVMPAHGSGDHRTVVPCEQSRCRYPVTLMLSAAAVIRSISRTCAHAKYARTAPS